MPEKLRRQRSVPASIPAFLKSLMAIAMLLAAACSGSKSDGDTDDGSVDAADATPMDAGLPDGGDGGLPQPAEDLTRDIVSTDLQVEIQAQQAVATIELVPSTTSTAASFETDGLTVVDVRNNNGPLLYQVVDGRLDVGVPAGSTTVIVEYGFGVQPRFQGLMDTGSTLTWPYWCGNLFPCHSDPADGLTFTMTVTDLPTARTAVYPAAVPGEASAYMLAWAVGNYTQIDLGTTAAGTHLSVWHLPGSGAAATQGTANLVQMFEWLETKFGPYAFGTEAGTVEVDWGAGAYGGMEHHPIWHVSEPALDDETIHAHEAAHGWFGNGVRLACWEDLVLSEGTATYLAARIMTEVVGAAQGQAMWTSYQAELDALMLNADPKIAWPDGCGALDLLGTDINLRIPYMKGAYFFQALETRVGTAALDAALSVFYQAYVGSAATMQDLLDTIQTETGYDPNPCALSWLKSDPVGPAACP